MLNDVVNTFGDVLRETFVIIVGLEFARFAVGLIREAIRS